MAISKVIPVNFESKIFCPCPSNWPLNGQKFRIQNFCPLSGQFEGHGLVPRLDVKTLETHVFRHFPDMPLLFVIPEFSIITAFEVAPFHWTPVNAPPPPVCLHVRIILLLILEHLAAAFAEPPCVFVVVLKV